MGNALVMFAVSLRNRSKTPSRMTAQVGSLDAGRRCRGG